eukprot:scaffold519_cov331-Pavlova_lutheri.AAC.17
MDRPNGAGIAEEEEQEGETSGMGEMQRKNDKAKRDGAAPMEPGTHQNKRPHTKRRTAWEQQSTTWTGDVVHHDFACTT